MIFREILATGETRLKKAGIFEARVECEHMLMQLLGQSRSQIYLSINDQVPTAVEKQVFEWISAREKRIPLAYLLGDVFFHSLKLKVGPGCLIPRPETERLVDSIVTALSKAQPPTMHEEQPFVFADIGCGSGAIALALLKHFPEAKAVLVDVSPEALEIARENTAANGLSSRAELILSDLFLNIPSGRMFDLIVSNPPYLTDEDMRQLQPEVAFEPQTALIGGADGLDFYRRIVPQAKKFLKPGGMLGFEIGAEQAKAVRELLEKNGYTDVRVFNDHQQIERILLCRSASAQ